MIISIEKEQTKISELFERLDLEELEKQMDKYKASARSLLLTFR